MINIIVAVDKNKGIGKNNSLLAHLKPDLKYFKNTTKGHAVVMGHNTYLSLPKRPLPDRTNIVLTTKEIELEGAIVVHSIDELLSTIKNLNKEIFICGGASLYRQMLPYADRLYVTHIFESFEADTFFPDINSQWEIEKVTANRENIEHEHPHIFTVYKRI
jgi:dihydrofolate reductase